MKYFIYILVLNALLASCNGKNTMESSYKLMETISVASNMIYKRTDASALQLDVYYPVNKLGKEPWDRLSGHQKPTLIYFHGGGWIEGERGSRVFNLLPYLEKNWCVVNVDYRMLQETHLIGSLNDCIDAINWIYDNAASYDIDTDRIYLSRESAGGAPGSVSRSGQ